MKYDDASWHYGGEFPDGLPEEAGATHIGMFASWALTRGLAGAIHHEDFPEALESLKQRRETPGSWFYKACDGKLIDEDLNDEGNRFAQFYYAEADGQLIIRAGSFLADYEATFPEFDDLYSVTDTWESFDRLSPIIDRRFQEWRNLTRLD